LGLSEPSNPLEASFELRVFVREDEDYPHLDCLSAVDDADVDDGPWYEFWPKARTLSIGEKPDCSSPGSKQKTYTPRIKRIGATVELFNFTELKLRKK
jgi:hypothetical protein